MQDGKQQVLLVNARGVLGACFEYGQLQNVRSPLVQHQLMRVDRHPQLVLAHLVLKLVLYRLHVQSQAAEHVDDGAFLGAQHAQQQMLRTYGTAGQTGCLLAAKGENLGDFG